MSQESHIDQTCAPPFPSDQPLPKLHVTIHTSSWHSDSTTMSLLRLARAVPQRGLHISKPLLAGHLKWQNIRHDKAKNDAKKSKEAHFLASRIEASVKSGGTEGNAQLQTLMEKARKMNVTKKIIENAIKRGTGEVTGEGSAAAQTTYEFMGPNGTAFIIEAETDNKARTIGRVKHAMTKFNANLSPCQYLFQRKGEIVFEPLNGDEQLDDVLEVAIDIGADDVENFNDVDDEYGGARLFRILTDPSELNSVSNSLASRGYKLRDSKSIFHAEDLNQVDFPEDQEKAFGKMIQQLDEISEVTNYYMNIRQL